MVDEVYYRKTVLRSLIRRCNREDLFKDDIQHLISCLKLIRDCDTDQDFNLLCLTSVTQVAQKIAELQNTDKGVLLDEVLVTGSSIPQIIMTVLKTTSDKFVVYAAQKSLAAVVNILNSQIILGDVLAEISRSFENGSTSLELTVSLEMLTSLLSCQHRENVIECVIQLFPLISKTLVKTPKTEEEKITFVACLNLTAKCVTILQTSNKYEKIDILIKYVKLEGVDSFCIVDSVLLGKILYFFNALFPYSTFLTKNSTPGPGTIQFGNSILKWIITLGIFQLPFDSQQGFGGNFDNLATLESKSDFHNSSLLRSLALLVTKVTAFIFQDDTRVGEVSVACECLRQLSDVATQNEGSNKKDHWMKRKCYKGFDWITNMFGDQDDALFEGMLALLNIHLIKKRTELAVVVHDVPEIAPHRQFYQFLRMTDFDHSILVDLVTSPETCFLLYLTRYLKYTLVSWQDFTWTHRQLQQDMSLCEGTVVEQATLSGDTDQRLTSDSGQGTTPVIQRSDDEQLCLVESFTRDHVENTSDAERCQELAVSREVCDTSTDGDEITKHSLHTSAGLDLLCLYDSDEDSDVQVSLNVERIESVETLATASENVNLSLDNTMATLIRLRLKILSLSSAGLFPYNASPLIKLIEKCEQLYEH